MHDYLIPVRGTIRGSRVEGEICNNGVGTYFLGPDGAAGSSFAQSLDTTMELSDARVDDFQFSMPPDVFSASISGFAGATSAEVGNYSSTENCGWLNLELTFPIPPGVICPNQFGPCGPDCAGEGEMFVCMPAHPRRLYEARPGAQCVFGNAPPQGEWQLTITSVESHAIPDTVLNFQTHGRLTATLVNSVDATDSVQLDLEF
jgi:hypothetical protein